MSKLPRTVFHNPASPYPLIFAFPPNRETFGATAYLIVENTGNVLVDCPAWNQANQKFLHEQGGVKTLVITHRGAIANVREIQQTLGCSVVIQEQEAYLIPRVELTQFQTELELNGLGTLIWTPGHTPGSACLHCPTTGILFSGRHLLPNPQGHLAPLRTAKTFHWPRQLRSVQLLLNRLTPETLKFVCPGANLGFLRGQLMVDRAYEQLSQLDLASWHSSLQS